MYYQTVGYNGKKNKKLLQSRLQDNEQRKEIEENSNNTNTGFPQRKETEENSNNAKTSFLPDTSEQL